MHILTLAIIFCIVTSLAVESDGIGTDPEEPIVVMGVRKITETDEEDEMERA
jgi:hypothetical protein